MARLRPEVKLEMESTKLVKEIWEKELNRADKLTVNWQETISGDKLFMTIENGENKSTQIHGSSFEVYFNAGNKDFKKQYREGIKAKLEQLL